MFTPADFKLPATPRKQRSPHDEGLYIYKYKCVCVCVSRSCLAHTVLTCMEYWSLGFGEAFLSVHPQLISSLRQPQESTDAPRMKVYICIYIYTCKYVCVCVSRSCLAHTVLTCMEYWSCIPTNKSNW